MITLLPKFYVSKKRLAKVNFEFYILSPSLFFFLENDNTTGFNEIALIIHSSPRKVIKISKGFNKTDM